MENEQLVIQGLFALLALVALSWIFTFVRCLFKLRNKSRLKDDIARQISNARSLGLPLDNISFDEYNSLIISHDSINS